MSHSCVYDVARRIKSPRISRYCVAIITQLPTFFLPYRTISQKYSSVYIALWQKRWHLRNDEPTKLIRPPKFYRFKLLWPWFFLSLFLTVLFEIELLSFVDYRAANEFTAFSREERENASLDEIIAVANAEKDVSKNLFYNTILSVMFHLTLMSVQAGNDFFQRGIYGKAASKYSRVSKCSYIRLFVCVCVCVWLIWVWGPNHIEKSSTKLTPEIEDIFISPKNVYAKAGVFLYTLFTCTPHHQTKLIWDARILVKSLPILVYSK